MKPDEGQPVAEGEAHPTAELVMRAARAVPASFSPVRATRVPFTAVMTGPERTATDNATSGGTCSALRWPT